jgi:hypothetical protein
VKRIIIILTLMQSLCLAADYKPLALSANELNLSPLPVAKEIEGTKGNDYIIADITGSKILARGGLNYIVLKGGNNQVFFSLCGSKIIDSKVSVIENFNPKKDKLKIFCGHNKINHSQLSIEHVVYNDKPITYVHVNGKHHDSAIALLGNIDLKISDIILNERFKKQ